MAAAVSGGSPSQALALRRGSRSPSRSPSPTPDAEEKETLVMPPGGFPTFEAAEEAFIALLRHTGIDEHMPWEKVMPKVVMHPLYKALQTLGEKKNAWAKVGPGSGWQETQNADWYSSAVHHRHRAEPPGDQAGPDGQAPPAPEKDL